MKQIIIMLSLLLTIACATYQKPGSEAEIEKDNSVTAASVSGDTVGILEGKKITREEVETFIGPALAQVRQQEYQIMSQGLKDYIFYKLQERESALLGVTVEDYFKTNVLDKAPTPSEDEITKTINQYRSRLPKEDAEARAKVVEFLESQKIQLREEEFKKELLAGISYSLLLEPPRNKIDLTEKDANRGPADAPIVLVEYSDFECPYCGKIQETLDKLMKEYDGKIRHYFKNLPLEFHKNAKFAAEAALCANEQGKYWETHDWMYKNRAKLNMEGIKEYATANGMDVEALSACIEKNTYAKQIAADMAEAQVLGATATPTFFINGRMLRGAQPYEKFKEIIDQELELKAQKGN